MELSNIQIRQFVEQRNSKYINFIHIDLVVALVSANIPLNKLENVKFETFLKNTQNIN